MPPENPESADQQSLVSRQTAWRLVLIMTSLLVLALLAVVWGFVRQARIAMATPPSVATPAQGAKAPTAVRISLAPGDRIISATTDAGKLVLHVSTPTGGEVDIVDLATGKLTSQVRTGP